MEGSEEQQFNIKHYSLREILRRVREMMPPARTRLLLVTLLVLFSASTAAILPLFVRYAVDVGMVKERNFAIVLAAMGLFLVVHFGHFASWFKVQQIIYPLREEILFAMRSRGYRHLQRLCMRFHDSYPSGFLHDRMFEQSIIKMGEAITYVLAQLAANTICLIVAVVACLHLSVPLTFVLIAGVVGYTVICQVIGPRIRRRTLDYTTAHNWISGYILDRLRGTKTIQAYTLEEHAARDFDSRVWPLQLKCAQMYIEQVGLSFGSQLIGGTITAALYILAGFLIINRDIEVGVLIAFVMYQRELTVRINFFISMYGQIVGARAGFDQFFTIMDTPSSVREKPGAIMPPNVKGRIEFDNVTFAYDRTHALLDTTFTVEPNQVVALVGRSGSGKTTISNLLMRFYDPDSGEIRLDGVPIKDMPLREYRAQYGIVLQDPFLFDDTIEANLRSVKPDATDEQVREALRRACALDFVQQFPDGIHQRVGEGGTRLSGGQRQRIAIARCLLLEPRILILDEATSALDNEAESLIHQALWELFKGRTAFIIAHRLNTIRDADYILVLDEGRVVEHGTFKTLLEHKGVFHKLYRIATSTGAYRLKMDEAGFA